MKGFKYLVFAIAYSLVSACTSVMEMLPKMSKEELVDLSDKNVCDYLLWVGSEQIENFKNEVDHRGLSQNQCCYQKIQKAPLYCYGYVISEMEDSTTFPPSGDVLLYLDKKQISRKYVVIGRLYDEWDNSSKTEAKSKLVPAGSEFSGLFSAAQSGEPISKHLVMDRFHNFYQERAKEIGANALLLVLAEKKKFSNKMHVGTVYSPDGLLKDTHSVDTSGVKTRLLFRVIKFTD
jgi:hypothetical protein